MGQPSLGFILCFAEFLQGGEVNTALLLALKFLTQMRNTADFLRGLNGGLL